MTPYRWLSTGVDGRTRELSDDDIMQAVTVWTALGFPKDVQPVLDVVAAARAYISQPGWIPLDWPIWDALVAAVAALG